MFTVWVSESQVGMISSPGRYLTISGDIFDCHNWGPGHIAPGIQYGGARNVTYNTQGSPMLQQRIIHSQTLILVSLRNLCLNQHNSAEDIFAQEKMFFDVAYFINMCERQFIHFSCNLKRPFDHFKKHLEKNSHNGQTQIFK